MNHQPSAPSGLSLAGNILLALTTPLLCIGGLAGMIRIWQQDRDFIGIVAVVASFIGFAFSALVAACAYQSLWNTLRSGQRQKRS